MIRPYFLPCDLDLGVWLIFWRKKTLTLFTTFVQWLLELWYLTLVFFVIRPSRGYHYFRPCDLDLGVWPIFWKTLTLLITFEQWVLELWYFHMSIIWDKKSPWSSTNNFYLVTLTLVFDLLYENLLTLLITMELWGLELWYVTWVFLVTEPIHGYQYFLPCDLDLVFFSSSNEVLCRVGAANVHNFTFHAFFCLEHVFIFL